MKENDSNHVRLFFNVKQQQASLDLKQQSWDFLDDIMKKWLCQIACAIDKQNHSGLRKGKTNSLVSAWFLRKFTSSQTCYFLSYDLKWQKQLSLKFLPIPFTLKQKQPFKACEAFVVCIAL